jgi:hypothetical protein
MRLSSRHLLTVTLAALAIGVALNSLAAVLLWHSQTATIENTERLSKENQRTLVRIERLRAGARDESCERAEIQERSAVVRLLRTYQFLDDFPAGQKVDPITRAVVRGLPDTYREAKEAKAPSFCDLPGVGLPEPSARRLPPVRDFRSLIRP